MSEADGGATLASTAEIRGHFPALERLHAGRPVAYFDGPGGTQVPRAVAEAMTDYLLHHNANTHWHYPSSIETDAAIDAAREAVADLLGAAGDEVAFGANMTTLAFHVARGLAREWAPGDEVVITELDHHANQAPWTAVAEERGLVVQQVPFDAGSGRLDLDALRTCLGPRTRLVAVGAASNALGTVTDVARVTRMAHAAGALCFVDAVHAAPHLHLDVRAIGCDFLACSPYKFYGPHVGVLYGRRDRLAVLRAPKLRPAPDTAPEKLETGTQSHEAIVGTRAAVDFLASLAVLPGGGTRRTRLAAAFAGLHARGVALGVALWDGLAAIPGVTLHGPGRDEPRTPTVAFTVRNVPAAIVCERLAAEGVFVSHGGFYATTVV